MRSKDILSNLGWETLKSRRYNLKKNFMAKVMSGRAPKYIEDLFRTKEQITSLVLRDSSNKLVVPFPKTDCFKTIYKLQRCNFLEQFTQIGEKCSHIFHKVMVLRLLGVRLV